ncbi:Mitochondrial import inner membrane translocase subunit tim17 [Thalictrum thalictroides]|uniref:Mitochondrial import inner membrane translocase subunit tim17 n=1 Tax=Thalictrum thalictroides TaxID=46969 RepID=A0A7J6X2M4_THATH|nr:Mitochondrial import inner membrane translocase subunit tim17 [Thalictrum thalictroides]
MEGRPDNFREPCPDRIIDDIGGAFGMGSGGGAVYHFIVGARRSEKGQKFAGGFQNTRMFAPRTGGGFAVWGGLFSTFDCSMVYLRQKEDPYNSVVAGALTGGLLQIRQGARVAGKSALVGGCLLALIEGMGIMISKLTTPSAEMQQQMAYGMPPPQQMPMPQQGGGYYTTPQQAGGYYPPQQAGAYFPTPQQQRTEEGSLSSWIGGLFGVGEKKQETMGGDIKNESLDDFVKPSAGLESEGSPSWLGGMFGGGKKKDKAEVLESFDTPSAPIPNFDYK